VAVTAAHDSRPQAGNTIFSGSGRHEQVTGGRIQAQSDIAERIVPGSEQSAGIPQGDHSVLIRGTIWANFEGRDSGHDFSSDSMPQYHHCLLTARRHPVDSIPPTA
jgi:hypothetical protein